MKSLYENIVEDLEAKNAYGFWSDYNGSTNLVRTGKTGTNLMDVLMLYFEFKGE